MNQKFIWTSVLLVATCSFLLGLLTNQYLYFGGTIILAFIVYRKGYDVLFKEYDDKQKERRKKSKELMQKMRKN